MVTVPAIWALSITCVRVSAQGGCVFRGGTCLCRTCPSADVLFVRQVWLWLQLLRLFCILAWFQSRGYHPNFEPDV